jgi:hypothetical protein
MLRIPDLSGQTLSHYECGDAEPKWPTLVRLLQVLGPELLTEGLGRGTAGATLLGPCPQPSAAAVTADKAG